MRDFKLKLKIIWCVLTDKYTSNPYDKCWWLWNDKNIMICFGKKNFHMFDKANKEVKK